MILNRITINNFGAIYNRTMEFSGLRTMGKITA